MLTRIELIEPSISTLSCGVLAMMIGFNMTSGEVLETSENFIRVN